ncbi:phosphatidate cytidylyltransferase [Candidatus Pelagibacter sp.]|nr:phosphatidate cytidylyltransferase [Candidatus Pelagibacter sp.]
MKSKNLLNRLFTSIVLIFLLALSFNYSYILIISLIFISLISWIELKSLISKIFKKNKIKTNFYRLSIHGLSLIYLTLFSVIIFSGISQDYFKMNMLYLFSICICSDVGGLFFGKIFKGKKLTKISPNKTISGSVGSFVLSLCLVPVFHLLLIDNFSNLINLILLTILVSFFCQLGDLFISFLKRKAKVKDTGNILPGHGGLLDRIDGMILAIPLGVLIWELLIFI